MKKLTKKEIKTRLEMYDEAINALFCYESADADEIETSQKEVVIRQINAIANRFAKKHGLIVSILTYLI